MRRLTSSDREFFELIRAAAFSNPFGAERGQLDRRIAGQPTGEVNGSLSERTVAEVRARVLALRQGQTLRPDAFESADRDRLTYGILFDVFHRFHLEFDTHIELQSAAGDMPLKPAVASEVLATLTAFGFPPALACSYLALFFQLRRAYHFIDRGLTGSGPSMQDLRRHLWDNVFTQDMRWYEQFLWNRMEDFSTLLLGETGTGKGTAAAAIGRSGYIAFDEPRGRFARSFTANLVALNLSQFPEALIESELFGHRKGAFTGAMDDHAGMFSRCPPNGAIFLDEIGEVTIPVQIKLLQILQERSYSPVGSHVRHRFEGRVIAATNRDLVRLRGEGRFRDDFYYRLCSDVITMPTLRQRLAETPGELDELLDVIIRRVTGHARAPVLERVREVLDAQVPPDYAWPGNVRELEQAVRQILITRRYCLPQAPAGATEEARLAAELGQGRLTADEVLARYCRLLHRRLGSYGDVARVTALDWRTVKKYIAAGDDGGGPSS